MRWVLLLLWVCAAAHPARADLVLNEILYDPEGSDAGAEFVELFNPGTAGVSLEGVELAFVNGADPSAPRSVWIAAATDVVGPRSFFVVGEDQVLPRDVTTTLGLQNGPDGLRLLRDGTVLDAVAWGDLSGVGEGSPAPDVSGTSLGRVPDGRDTGDNATDFERLPAPTPGQPNAAESRLVPIGFELEPPWRPDPGVVRVSVRAVARGYGERQQAPLHWVLDARAVADGSLEAARGDTTRGEVALQLDLGPHELLAVVGTAAPDADTLAIAVQIGVGAVVLNEVMAHPRPEHPEWVELRVLGSQSVDLTGWGIADRGHDARVLREGAVLSPGELALVSQDPQALRATFAVDPSVLCTSVEGGWPSLNNTSPGAGEPADEVVLFDSRGAVVDRLAYDESMAAEAGRGIERGLIVPGAEPVWFPSPGAPTPGRANVTAGAREPESGLLASPNPFTPDGDGIDDVLHVVLRDVETHGDVAAEILHLSGDRIRDLGSRPAGSGVQQWIWDGRDAAGRLVPLGAYVVVVHATASGAPSEAVRWRALVALGRGR
jgi:hypothetical protein